MSKKFYKNEPKRTLRTKKRPKFSKEQLTFYNGFYGNPERLEREWNVG